MRKTLLAILALMLVCGLVGVAFGGGFWAGRLNQPPAATATVEVLTPEATVTVVPTPTLAPSPTPEVSATPVTSGTLDYALMEEVLGLLHNEFYGDIPDSETLTYGAIRGLLLTLDDPNTAFIEPDTARILNEDATGQFEGIGAWVNMREDGYLEIVRPMPGQPAEAAGIQAGDIIISVDGQKLLGLGLYEALNLIRGPRGTQVTLEIARQSEPDYLTFTITRARIDIPVVEYEMRDDGIAYIRLTEFDATAKNRVETALNELLPQNPVGVIFDLRDNPGGYLDQAIGVADLFLGDGLVLIERDSGGGVQRYSSYDGDIAEDIPLVVLVNGGSASASEIVSGAFQDRGRAPLIGEQTFGKGSVQRPHALSDGAQFRVTIAHWFTPDDHSIHGEGLTPNIVVPFPTDTPEGTDPQLQRAVDYLLQGE